MGIFYGREFHKETGIFAKMLGGSNIQRNISPKLETLLRTYVFLFGIPHPSSHLRACYLKKFARGIHFSKSLDAGCGIGLHSITLAKMYSAATIDACDIDPELVSVARKVAEQEHLSNLSIFEQDLSELNRPEEYDFIFWTDVLEHIEDDERIIRNLWQSLKKDGILYLGDSHQRHIKPYFDKLLHYEQYEYKGHVRDGYTEEGLKTLLTLNGFNVKEVRNTWGVIGEAAKKFICGA